MKNRRGEVVVSSGLGVCPRHTVTIVSVIPGTVRPPPQHLSSSTAPIGHSPNRGPSGVAVPAETPGDEPLSHAAQPSPAPPPQRSLPSVYSIPRLSFFTAQKGRRAPRITHGTTSTARVPSLRPRTGPSPVPDDIGTGLRLPSALEKHLCS